MFTIYSVNFSSVRRWLNPKLGGIAKQHNRIFEKKKTLAVLLHYAKVSQVRIKFWKVTLHGKLKESDNFEIILEISCYTYL